MADRIDVKIDGAEKLARVAGAVQNTAPELRKDLLRGLRAAAKPAVKEIKAEARSTLPQRGGLAEWIAKSTIGLRTRTSGKSAGLRIEGRKSGHDLDALDRGRLRHPLFGNRRHWFQQDIKPGFFTNPIINHTDRMTLEVLRTLDEFMAEVDRRASS